MAKDTLSVTDNRTGKNYEIPIEEGNVIRATALREIKTGPDDFGMMSYDPALVNTATCKSRGPRTASCRKPRRLRSDDGFLICLQSRSRDPNAESWEAQAGRRAMLSNEKRR